MGEVRKKKSATNDCIICSFHCLQ